MTAFWPRPHPRSSTRLSCASPQQSQVGLGREIGPVVHDLGQGVGHPHILARHGARGGENERNGEGAGTARRSVLPPLTPVPSVRTLAQGLSKNHEVMRVREFKGGRVVVASVAVLALASGLAACGGDDDDDDAGSTTETTAGGDAESADTELCDENIELNAALGGLFESRGPGGDQGGVRRVGPRRTARPSSRRTRRTRSPLTSAAGVFGDPAARRRRAIPPASRSSIPLRSTSTSSRTATTSPPR